MAGETSLVKQTLTELGILHTFANSDTVNNNKFANPNGNDLFLLIKNPGASTATVTITAQNTSFSKVSEGVLTKTDTVVAMGIGEERLVGPFPKGSWNDVNSEVILIAGGAGASDIDYALIEVPKF